MTDVHRIEGRAAALRIDNLDTDQIMPKQFLRGIDKSGLAHGLLHDLRFDAAGLPRPECPLDRPGDGPVRILVGGANFGCGSSREHAVWGLLQFGIAAVIAPSYGEIFHSNAMQNRLLLVSLPTDVVERLMGDAEAGGDIRVDVERMRVASANVDVPFELSPRHRLKILSGRDDIDLSLMEQARIAAFARAHEARQPWLRDVAAVVRARLDRA
jgi:3-isopropylmalate/(R)-2-methylmalate dehydratase small subunit